MLPRAPSRYRIRSVNDRGIRSLYAAGMDVETAVDPPELRIFADDGRVETDREALVAFYKATDGENWRDSTNWLSAAPLGEWRGVTTDDAGRVTELNLVKKDLRGEIPAEVGKLANLRKLALAFNDDLTGEIPPELGSLSNPTDLILASNHFSGEIPAEVGKLANLRKLDLGGKPVERVRAKQFHVGWAIAMKP